MSPLDRHDFSTELQIWRFCGGQSLSHIEYSILSHQIPGDLQNGRFCMELVYFPLNQCFRLWYLKANCNCIAVDVSLQTKKLYFLIQAVLEGTLNESSK